MATQVFRLDNGLTVHITENHESPRFYAEIAVRAGGKNDPSETTGLAHYFEHLMFKGTPRMGTLDYAQEKPHLDRIVELYEQHFREQDPEKRAALYQEIDAENVKAAEFAVPNEMDRVYNAMGGADVNAHTGTEETVYKVSLPKNRLRQWAAIESDRFSEPVFRLFPTELETVYEEKNRSLDNKHRVIFEAVDAVLYKHHPYGQQTILGTVEDLKNPSILNIQRFFETWYVPGNMAISISGDVDAEETIAVIDEYFSKLPSGKVPKAKKWKEEPLKGREYVEVNYEGEEYVLLAFRTAPRGSKDTEELMLLDMILDNATAGLINLNLNQQQRVRQAGSFPQLQNDYGAQYLYGVPKDGQTLEEVEQLLLDQVELIKKGEFEDWILPAIINDFKKREKGGLESNSARASALSEAFIAHEPWEHAVESIPRLEKVTKKDIVRVAKKYFSGGYVAGYRKDAPHDVPDVEKPALTKVEIDPSRQSAFAAEIMSMPAPPIAPEFIEAGRDYQELPDPKGTEFYYVPNTINDIFTFSVSVDFGSLQDNTIAAAILLLEKSGTERLSPEDLKKEWYRLGTDFSMGAGDNQTTISMSGLDENFEASVALMMEVLMKPAVDEATLEQLKEIILAEREDAKKQAPAIASAVVNYNRYGQESRFLRMLPTAELKALTVDQLHGITRGLLGFKHTIAYTGSLPMEKVQAVMAKCHPVAETLADPPAYRVLPVRDPAATEIYFFDKEAAQTQVRIEFGAGAFDEALTPAEQLYNEYFAGGMAGIVFQELREARGLAYVAGARYFRGYRAEEPNLMVGVIQTQPDKTIEALDAFVDLLDRLPESPERFEFARQSILNQYRTGKIGFRGIIGAVRDWERFHLVPDPRQTRFEALQTLGMDAMLGFNRDRVAGRPKLISVVGDAKKMDMDALKKLGPVRELSLKDIFVD